MMNSPSCMEPPTRLTDNTAAAANRAAAVVCSRSVTMRTSIPAKTAKAIQNPGVIRRSKTRSGTRTEIPWFRSDSSSSPADQVTVPKWGLVTTSSADATGWSGTSKTNVPA